MKLEKIVKDYQGYLEILNFSERTIETYCGYVKRFVSFIKTFYPRIQSFDKITKEIILDFQSYIAHLKDKKAHFLV